MMGSMASFTMNDALMKGLSGQIPIPQAVFLRGIGTTVMMYILARSLNGLRFDLPWAQWRILLARNVTEVGSAFLFISAFFNMPLANATSILQVMPLVVTLAGALFLGERVGWRRWVAIGIGFIGVLIIVRPGMAGFNQYSLYALGAVVLIAIRDLLSRRLSKDVPNLTVAFLNAVAVMVVFGLASLTVDWVAIAPVHALRMAGAAVLLIGGYLFAVSAMRVGEIAVVSPFRYTALIWSILLGILMFGDWPDRLTLIGGFIVVSTGVYAFYREHKTGAQSGAVDKG